MPKKKTIWITSAAAAAVLAVGGASVAVATGGFEGIDDDQPLTGSTLERVTEVALAEVGPGTVTDAETSDDTGSAYEVEVALENGDEVDVELNDAFEVVRVGQPETDDDDVAGPPLSEADRAEAEDAALAEAGAGTVTDVERSDDADSAYEVEVALENGGAVDVELTEDFQVVQVETDQDD